MKSEISKKRILVNESYFSTLQDFKMILEDVITPADKRPPGRTDEDIKNTIIGVLENHKKFEYLELHLSEDYKEDV